MNSPNRRLTAEDVQKVVEDMLGRPPQPPVHMMSPTNYAACKRGDHKLVPDTTICYVCMGYLQSQEHPNAD